MGALNEWYAEYKDRADFVVVYVREAHPTDGRLGRANVNDGILYATPQTFEERKAIAKACEVGLALKIPLIIDKMDDAVEMRYQGWPDRIYIIGKDGKVAYDGGRGPRGFRPKLAMPVLKEMVDSVD